MSKPIGEAGLALIKNFEGCRLRAYKPVPTEKYWTIGWGHYGADVREGQIITQEQADAMLVRDIQRFADCVDDPTYCPLPLNDNQRDALISFAYNCGNGSLRTLCKGRTLQQIADAMLKYNLSGGKPLPGLTRRRKAERELFLQEEDMNLSKLTDDDILYLINRIQGVLGKQEQDGAVGDELREAVAMGITDGTRPKAYCTRAQAAVMVKRAAKK